MQRSGHTIGPKDADTAVGRHEEKPFLRLEKVGNPNRPAKMGEVRAAAHADVLADIH